MLEMPRKAGARGWARPELIALFQLLDRTNYYEEFRSKKNPISVKNPNLKAVRIGPLCSDLKVWGIKQEQKGHIFPERSGNAIDDVYGHMRTEFALLLQCLKAPSGTGEAEVEELKKELKGKVDLWNYYQRDIPVIMLSSGGFPEHHSIQDTINLIDFEHLYIASQLLYALIRELGDK